MTSHFEFGSIANPEEADKLGEILSQCFNANSDMWPMYRERLGLENFRVLRKQGQIVAGFGIYPMGQWWGDRCVPMAGVSAVGVPPEHRGTGVALELMSRAIQEFHANGIAIATLYPATQRLYRKIGYEQGGTRCLWEMPIENLIVRSERSLPMHPVKEIKPEIFHETYSQQALKNNGNLERNSAIWQNTLQHPELPVYAYLFGSETQPEGYIIFSQKSEQKEVHLNVWDWVALTPAAQHRLLTFIADHRSQINKVIWRGSSLDRLLLMLPEQTAKIREIFLWFLRIIDVKKALEKRGYPARIEADLHLAIQDNLIPENNGNFILQVSNKRGELSKGGRGDLQLNERGLASLYAGLFTPYQLQLNGQLEATDEALSVATGLFAGAQPWMPDFF